jgi:hypothetical protein
MLLHIKTIPDSIQRAIYDAIDKDWEGALDQPERFMEMEKILEGTHWLKDNVSNNADVFAGMDIPKEKTTKAAPMKLVGKKTNTYVEPTDIRSKKLF